MVSSFPFGVPSLTFLLNRLSTALGGLLKGQAVFAESALGFEFCEHSQLDGLCSVTCSWKECRKA